VQFLLRHGADAGIVDANGQSALTLARGQGATKIIAILERTQAARSHILWPFSCGITP
jgi:ankyrin repeat protein